MENKERTEARTSTATHADRLIMFVAGGGLVGFAVAALISLDATNHAINEAFSLTTRAFGLYWQLLAVATALVAIGVAVSPLGTLRLGGLEQPEMPGWRWIAIILCTLLAGGGVFWSAAEPLAHFMEPAPYFSAIPGARQAAVAPAMAVSFLHWGVLAWSLVGTLGAVSLMLLHERGVPLAPRALLAGVLPQSWLRGRLGSVVDAFAIIAALAGTIGPVGFLGLQLAYAARVTLGAPDGYLTQLAVLVALIALATASVVSGVDRGIQLLSRMNVTLAILLGLALLLLGPTGFILAALLEGGVAYLRALPTMALYREDPQWLEYWTVFYWGWYLGYGPLMSIFVARVSRGRTLREIVIAVAVVAPILTHVWFAALGGSGLSYELASPGSVSDPMDADGLPAALLAIVSQMPAATLLQPAFILLTFVFLTTTVDSMAYSASMIVTGNDDPPRAQRLFWALGMGVVAALLLVRGEDAVRTLQSLIGVAAIPAAFLMTVPLWTAPRLALRAWRQRAGK